MRDARLTTRVDCLAQGDVTVVLEPLEFIKLVYRYEHRCGLPVLRQHNTLMAAPGPVDQLGEMTAGLRNRTHERHSCNVQRDADSPRQGAPTGVPDRLGLRELPQVRQAEVRLRAPGEVDKVRRELAGYREFAAMAEQIVAVKEDRTVRRTATLSHRPEPRRPARDQLKRVCGRGGGEGPPGGGAPIQIFMRHFVALPWGR